MLSSQCLKLFLLLLVSLFKRFQSISFFPYIDPTGIQENYTLVITREKLSESSRFQITVNGSIPAPTLSLTLGNTIQVKVINYIYDDSTSIHWHGMDLSGRPWMDGIINITQCPISNQMNESHNIFIYQFTPTTPGTFWYHGHYHSQYPDGLYGPLLVKRKDEELIYMRKGLSYQQDEVILLADYFETEVRYLVNGFMAPNSNGFDPVPDAFTVNNYRSNQLQIRIPVNETNHGDDRNGYHTRIRLRIINAGTASVFNFSVANQSIGFTVIEIDGIPIQPLNLSMIRIQPAQRFSVIIDFTSVLRRSSYSDGNHEIPFSVVLNPQYYPQYDPTAVNQGLFGSTCGKPLNFTWIGNFVLERKKGNQDGTNLVTTNPISAASRVPTISFDQTSSTPLDNSNNPPSPPPPLPLRPKTKPKLHSHWWIDSSLHDGTTINNGSNTTIDPPATNIQHDENLMIAVPEFPMPVPNATYKIEIYTVFYLVGDNQVRAYINGGNLFQNDGIAPVSPETPLLYNLLLLSEGNNNQSTQYKFDTSQVIDSFISGSGSSPFILPENAVIDVFINGYCCGTHPFHLHGHHFWIINTSDSQQRYSDPPSEQGIYPIRDIVTVPFGGYAHIRFVTDNPGIWLFHCHIFWHLTMGLGAWFVETTNATNYKTLSEQLPTQQQNLCNAPISQVHNYSEKWTFKYFEQYYDPDTTHSPVESLTAPPSFEPTTSPSISTFTPSFNPSHSPSAQLVPNTNSSHHEDDPSVNSGVPTVIPSLPPSVGSTVIAPTTTIVITSSPVTQVPAISPSISPSTITSSVPLLLPSEFPSNAPSRMPSNFPSISPSSSSPLPSPSPSTFPSSSQSPSLLPSAAPSPSPLISHSVFPSNFVSVFPSALPSGVRSSPPSPYPSVFPSTFPSLSSPSPTPTQSPSIPPSTFPSAFPSSTTSPSSASVNPSFSLSVCPSTFLSSSPSAFPSFFPSISPSSYSSPPLSHQPSAILSVQPTKGTFFPAPSPSFVIPPSPLPTEGIVSPTKLTLVPSIQFDPETVYPTSPSSYSPSLSPTPKLTKPILTSSIPSIQPSSRSPTQSVTPIPTSKTILPDAELQLQYLLYISNLSITGQQTNQILQALLLLLAQNQGLNLSYFSILSYGVIQTAASSLRVLLAMTDINQPPTSTFNILATIPSIALVFDEFIYENNITLIYSHLRDLYLTSFENGNLTMEFNQLLNHPAGGGAGGGSIGGYNATIDGVQIFIYHEMTPILSPTAQPSGEPAPSNHSSESNNNDDASQNGSKTLTITSIVLIVAFGVLALCFIALLVYFGFKRYGYDARMRRELSASRMTTSPAKESSSSQENEQQGDNTMTEYELNTMSIFV